jgi:hypothetical protein
LKKPFPLLTHGCEEPGANEAAISADGNPAGKRPEVRSNSYGFSNFKENEAVERFAGVPQIRRRRRGVKTKLSPEAAQSIESNE